MSKSNWYADRGFWCNGSARISKGNGGYLLSQPQQPPTAEYPLMGYYLRRFDTLEQAKKAANGGDVN